jgi:hypothetical protein
VGHARDANELLEVASNELWAIVGDDSPSLKAGPQWLSSNTIRGLKTSEQTFR